MTKQLTLNCDMGEGFGPWEMGDDKAIMPLIDAANIACGGHAGDPSTMRHCVEFGDVFIQLEAICNPCEWAPSSISVQL